MKSSLTASTEEASGSSDGGESPNLAPSHGSDGSTLSTPRVPSRTDRETLRLGIISIFVATMLVILGFWIGPIVAPHQPIDYSQAVALSFGAVFASYGGSWNVIMAQGVNLRSPDTVPFNWTAEGNCTFTPISGALTGNITLPAIAGSVGVGVSPVWFVILTSSTREAFVLVLNGAATVLGAFAGPELCPFLPYLPVPSNALTSEAAISLANEAGGSTYLALFPGANATFTVVGAYNTYPFSPYALASWGVGYVSCPLGSSTSGVGSAFGANMNATTGAISSSLAFPIITCPPNWQPLSFPFPP